MILIDVNVLVYAYRADAPGHAALRDWLEGLINSDQAYGFSDLVLSGFLRIVTHPRIFNPPSDLASALAFTLVYLVVPNRRIPLAHAVTGGLVASLLFELAKHGFGLYLTRFPTHQAIYGALATVPVFLIWLYISWMITLLGADCLERRRSARGSQQHP